MSDLVERLRMYGNKREFDATCGPSMREAADEIERLSAEIAARELAFAAAVREIELKK